MVNSEKAKNMVRKKINLDKVNSGLHWTTLYSEKLLLAVIGFLTMFAAGMDIYHMVLNVKVELADLFLLFIYAEIIGMVVAVNDLGTSRLTFITMTVKLLTMCQAI